MTVKIELTLDMDGCNKLCSAGADFPGAAQFGDTLFIASAWHPG